MPPFDMYQVPLVKQVKPSIIDFGASDQFKNDRYPVIRKLGYGGFTTVWLARDRICQRYIALKILVSEMSRDCSEVDIL
jgi:hypothetical protein